MRSSVKIQIIFALIILCLSTTQSVLASTSSQQLNQDLILNNEAFTLENGEKLIGNIFAVSSEVVLETNSTVKGDVVLMRGNLQVFGQINGDVSCMQCVGLISPSAIIKGDITSINSGLEILSDQVSGTIIQRGFSPTELVDFLERTDLDPGDFTGTSKGENFSNWENWFSQFLRSESNDQSIANDNIDFISKILISLIFTLGISALAMLVALLFPRNSSRITECFGSAPGVSWGVGLLTLFTVIVGMVITTFTIILIPVTIAALLLLFGAVLFGYVSVGFWIGHRISESSRTKWSEPIAAGVGTVILSILISAFSMIPTWIGGVISALLLFIVSMFGLGGVTLTIFGSKSYPRSKPALHPTYAQAGRIINANLGQQSMIAPPSFTQEQDLIKAPDLLEDKRKVVQGKKSTSGKKSPVDEK